MAGLAIASGAGAPGAGALGLLAAGLVSVPVANSVLRPMRDVENRLGRDHDQLCSELDSAAAGKEQLEAVLDAMAEGVLVLDASGRITLANPRLREFFDSWAEFSGRLPVEVLRHAQLDAILGQVRSDDAPRVEELEHVGPNDRTLLVHASRVPASGERTGTVAVFHDVSEIRALDSVRRDFIANASHELRTPLTSIQGFADTLAAGAATPAELQGPLEAIVRNSQRLGDLIDDLLELSRIEGRRDPLGATDVDIAQLCRMIVDDTEPRRRERQIEIDFDSETESIALADASAVERVVSNLIDNAIKYTDAGNRIHVSVKLDGPDVVVVVQDSGIGIPASDLERIFERFYRVDEARSRALGGTGLGLSIVKHLVQAMGGEIRVTSQPGKGSTFELRLPRPEPQGAE